MYKALQDPGLGNDMSSGKWSERQENPRRCPQDSVANPVRLRRRHASTEWMA